MGRSPRGDPRYSTQTARDTYAARATLPASPGTGDPPLGRPADTWGSAVRVRSGSERTVETVSRRPMALDCPTGFAPWPPEDGQSSNAPGAAATDLDSGTGPQTRTFGRVDLTQIFMRIDEDVKLYHGR